MLIRRASTGDSQAISAIYGHYIRHTEFTFDTKLVSSDEFRSRINNAELCHAFIVAQESGQVIGFAFTSPYKSKSAYQWIAESGIYLDHRFLSRGTGSALYSILIRLAQRQNYTSLLAGITTPNPSNEKLHRSLGFRPYCTYDNIGFKAGQWRQVVWWRKDFASFSEAPLPIRSLKEFTDEEFKRCGISP